MIAALAGLEALYEQLIRASIPENPQYEISRIIADLPNKREIVFMLGLLSEGENEAALIYELARNARANSAAADISHLDAEAWYYLRTSIDPQWQLDDRPPSAEAGLAYLLTVLGERLERLGIRPPQPPLINANALDRARLLRRLRAERTLAGEQPESAPPG